MWPFDDENEEDVIALEPSAFESLLEDVAVFHRSGWEDQLVEKRVETYPQRFDGFSTRMKPPQVAIKYRLDLDQMAYRTELVDAYEDDPDPVIEELSIEESFPGYVSLSEEYV